MKKYCIAGDLPGRVEADNTVKRYELLVPQRSPGSRGDRGTGESMKQTEMVEWVKWNL